jgi:hypothetical protein
MNVRPSQGLALFLLVLVLAALVLYGDLRWRQVQARSSRAEMTSLVRQLQLTDLCLSTEASYTRHPSQTDSFTPFADHPGAFEHFPSGTMIKPPPHLRERYAPIP